MRILKSHPLLRLVNSYIIDSPQPSNISYLWNFGSLLAVCLVTQIITGVILAMHYNPSVLEAFNSIEHIMRDVNNGWLIRYLHSNTASAFFFLVYLHIGRGLYYGSYRTPRTLVWTLGTIIFLLMMATAFLGYQYSPKWFLLNLYFLLNTLLSSNICYYISYSLLSLSLISLTLFYLDNFKLCFIYYIKIFQIFSFFSLLLVLILTIYYSVNIVDIVQYINDNNDINLHGHVNLNKEAGQAIGQGLSTIGSQIGLGATMVGVSTAVGKVITKSSMPPIQKAGVVIGGAVIAGFGHSIISAINRNSVSLENSVSLNNSNDVVNNINTSVNKLMDDSINSSPLEILLFDINGISLTCLSLILILIIQLIFKFYLKDNVNLNFSKLLGKNLNDKLEYYINKIINLNKKMSSIYIWLILLIVIIGLCFLAYASFELYSNIDKYITVHNNIKNK
jgi:Cytochrome b/b6/petB